MRALACIPARTRMFSSEFGRLTLPALFWLAFSAIPPYHPALSHAGVAELVDALDLGSSGATRGGSSPSTRTIAHQPNLAHRRTPARLFGKTIVLGVEGKCRAGARGPLG